MYRAHACKLLLDAQEPTPPMASFCQAPEALLLTAACVWLLNGIHATPEEGGSWRQLLGRILVTYPKNGTDRDIMVSTRGLCPENDNETDSDSTNEEAVVPVAPHGVVFLLPLKVGIRHPVPRFQRVFRNTLGSMFSPAACQHIFGALAEDIGTKYFTKRSFREVNPERVRNRRRITRPVTPPDDTPPPPIFNLTARGLSLIEVPRDEGSDMEVDGERESDGSDAGFDDNDSSHLNLDELLTKCWIQLLVDLTQTSPNHKAANRPSYCHLSEDARAKVNEKTYSDLHLSNYFRMCRWKRATHDDWNLAFKWLFPPLGLTHTSRAQNYKSARYLTQWNDVKARTEDEQDFTRIRGEIKRKFDKLKWIPTATCDRIWKCSSNAKGYTALGGSGPSPLILVRRWPTWS